MRLKFYQIYYRDEHFKECYDFATCHRNDKATDFFENTVIADLVPKTEADYIAVCSWRLKEKRQSGKCPFILGIYGNDDLSEEKIVDSDADVINLRPFSPGHQMLANAAQWHGGDQHNYAWDSAIHTLKQIIDIPKEVETPIYENHFVARKEIYYAYVNTCLSTVLEFMRDHPVFYKDSGYAEKKARQDKEAVERYRKETGRNDWPIAPFVLERLFSIWIDSQDFKIVNL
jgi:hypothetical protein